MKLAALGKTQQEIAEIIHWSREAVKNYVALKAITLDAWQIVIGTIKADSAPPTNDGVVPTFGTTVPKVFTEGLLRSITSLT